MLRRRFVSKTPEDPKVVETIGEFLQCVVQFFDTGEACEPKQLQLECSNESFDASVSFWTPDERWTRSNTDESQLILKCMRDELTSVIVTKCDACGDIAIDVPRLARIA